MEAAFEAANPDVDVEVSVGREQHAAACRSSRAHQPMSWHLRRAAPMDAGRWRRSRRRPRPVRHQLDGARSPRSTTPGRSTASLRSPIPTCSSASAPPQVPCGAYAREVFDAGRDRARRSTPKNPMSAHSPAKLAAGELDAGLVYATDVAGDARPAADDPTAARASTSVPSTRSRWSAVDRSRTARCRFVDFVASPEGRSILVDAGFGEA